MTRPTYYMTETALVHLEKAIRDTARRWNWRQAEIYRDILLEGFQKIAENHQHFNSPHRATLTKDTNFSIHLVGHHYVPFKAYDGNNVIIAGLFYEGMNIPERLKELQSMNQHEIAAIMSLIETRLRH